MTTKRLLEGGPYTPSKDMGPDYLARKFARIRKEIEAKKKQPGIVTPIKSAARK